MGHIQDTNIDYRFLPINRAVEPADTILIRTRALHYAIREWAQYGLMVPDHYAKWINALRSHKELLTILTREDCRNLAWQGVIFQGEHSRSLPNLVHFAESRS